jgi:hypothetical protein
MKAGRKDSFPRSGRKPAQESRATEFRRSLIAWKQTPKSSRPSLRALARELGTSHQLLGYYLKHWHEWEGREYLDRAEAIRHRAKGENRPMTPHEQQRAFALAIEAAHAFAMPALVNNFELIKRDAERGPLHRAQFKMLKIYAAEEFPGARELLEKCSRDGVKKRKSFAEIVRETPRRDGESSISWVRRIWDRSKEYDTKRPAVLTEELLEQYSRRAPETSTENNLPVVKIGTAKSFR